MVILFICLGAELINNDIVKPYLKKKSFQEKRSINFPNIIKLHEQIIKRDNKTYFFGVELPGFYKDEEPKIIKEQMEIDQPDEKSDEEDKLQRFFLTEEQNIHVDNPIKRKNEPKLVYQEEGTQELTIKDSQIDIKTNKLEEQNIQMNCNYDDFKKTAYQIVGENKEYENPINLNSAYKILKNIMKKPNTIDFDDFMEPHYMKPTSVIQKFKFNGLFSIFKCSLDFNLKV